MPRTITDLKRYNRMLKRGLRKEVQRLSKMQKLDQENKDLLREIQSVQDERRHKFGT